MLFEANALVYAAIASWHDVREKRVPNELNALYFLPTGAAGVMMAEDATAYLAFILSSFAFAYALFFFKIWGGGDAKCFIALSAGMPLLADGAEIMMLPISFVAAAMLMAGWRLVRGETLRGKASFVPFLCAGTLATAALFKSGIV
ncbi:MAG: prepilin peptidase [Candidatus Micrarchaeota archaeon]